MMGTSEMAEIVGLDLIFLESALGEDHDTDPQVTFGVKELLSDLRGTLERGISDLGSRIESKASASDISAMEARLNGRLENHGRRLDTLEGDSKANQIRWAKLGGMAASIGAIFGWFGATVLPHLFK